MSTQQLALLQADYQALAKEAGRRESNVREAAEKAHQLLKSSRDQALADLRADPPPPTQPLYQPIFLASATRNVKVIALAVSALQRLIASGAVPKGLVKQILDTLEQVIPQGVEIQLKILQTLVSLLTTTLTGAGDRKGERLVQGEELGQALELSHRLSTSKIPVVASTASATLRQLFMFVFERVGEEDALVSAAQSVADPVLLAALPPASFNLDVPPVEHDAAAPVIPVEQGKEEEAEEAKKAKSIALRPAARDAYLLLEDLCLLISGSADGGPDGEPSFLRWGSLSRTFGLELVESIVSGFGPVVRTHPELLLVLRAHLCPLLIRFLSSPPHPTSNSATTAFSFPLTLRLTRVVFLLLKQFSDLLALESEVFLTMFVRVIGPGDKGEGEGGHPSGPGSGNSPLWMRVLALEIFRGLCGDFQLMMKFYQRYDATKVKNGGGSSIFSDLMTAFNRLATEKPQALGSGAAVVYGSSQAPILGHQSHGNSSSVSLGGAAGMLDSAMETGVWLAGAAGSVVGSSVGAVAGAVPPGLSVTTSTLKLQCIDQLDKADAPPIPETYIFLLALQCLSSLSDGFATYTLSTYSAIIANRPRGPGEAASRAPSALDWTTLDPKSDPKVASLVTVKDMAETSWPALLASFSFFIATNLDDDLFADVVSALQNFTSVCGVLGLGTPREAFLTSLCKFAMPPAVVSHIASTSANHPAHHDNTAAGQLKTATSSVISAGVESLGLGGATPNPVGLSSRNFACLKALISVAHYLAGSLDATWFAVFETLQNAEFVIRTNAARAGRKRSAAGGGSLAVPATPPRGGSGPTPMSPSTSGSGSAPTKIPILPTEADEQAIQQSIAKLFEVSRSLDDDAFKWFVGALCRLNGEMIGIPMTEDGAVAEVGSSASSLPSPGEAPAQSGSNEARSRRRTSGITTIRSQRLGEKSFGVSKIGVVSLLNVHRLVYREPRLGWDVVTSHLLLVQHYVVAPPSIRLQAAEVLDQILVVAPKNISTGGTDLQQRVQTQVLTALAEQAEPSLRPQSSTDIEIRRMALDSLFKILESNGHAFISGWERIFHVLRTACPSPLLFHSLTAPASPLPDGAPTPSNAPFPSQSLDTITEDDSPALERPATTSYFGGAPTESKVARTPVLVRTSFPSLQLICTDFLGGLTVEELRDCISTLAEFGKQADDVNVALTAGGLLWSVSDHLQAKRKDGENDVAHGDLWMYLLLQLLGLCQDSRQEVRDGAITTIFRSISLYGSTLSKATWDATLWEVVFPLVEAISSSIQARNRLVAERTDDGEPPAPGEELVSQPNGSPIRLTDKQWDDSKTLALRSTGNVFFEYLPVIVKTGRYEETWAAFIGHLKRSFIEDRPQAATAAMQSLEKVLSVSLDGGEASRIASSWEVAWSAWDDIGYSIASLSHSASPSAAADTRKTFTQINLEAYIRCILPIYTPPYIAFDLTRIHRLLAILKAVLTFSRSPDYRPDVDSLTPLQVAILEVIAVINLEVPGAASAVLSDLSEYLTLAFVAAFDSETDGGRSRSQRISYIALTKETMPHVLYLFQKYKDDASIYEQGAVERMLAAYAIPIKLKHDCPAPAKFSSAELLWKTATVNFLKAVKDCVASLQVIGSNLPVASFEGIWRQIVEGFKGGLLADTDNVVQQTFEERHQEENFDLALLVSLEQDVLPFIGASLVPDDLIRRLGKYLQTASRLYELDLPDSGASTPSTPTKDDRRGSTTRSGVVSSFSASSAKETRFDSDFDRQAKGHDMYGTTAEVVEVGRERFAYWCFDLLFLLCSDSKEGHATERRRIASLCLPSLLNRCTAVIRTYVADAPLRGKMPFPRVRQEELIFVLQKLHGCRLREGTLWASTQSDPSSAAAASSSFDTSLPFSLLVRSALLRSPRAHLYELHHQFTSLLSLSTTSPSITSAYIPYRRIVGSDEDDSLAFKGLPEGFEVKQIGRAGETETGEGDVVQLALACLRLVGEEIGCGTEKPDRV